MKNYRILTRLMLKNLVASLNPFAERYDDGKKKKGRGKGTAILLAMLAVYGIGFMIWLEIQMFNVMEAMGHREMLPGMAIMLGMMLTLILGLFQGISELYQGKDAPLLATLPVTSRQVFAAKLTSLYVSETVINAAILFPAFLIYAIRGHEVFPTVLTAIPVWLLVSVLPLCVVSLISALLMRISGFAKHRETVTMVLSFGIAIAYSIFITRMNSSRDDEFGSSLAQSVISADLVGKVSSVFPPAGWAANAFTGDWLMLLLLLAVCAAGVWLVITLIGPGYVRQALACGEQTVSAKNSRSDSDMRTGSSFRALHRLEWRRLLRTPAWLFNGLAGVVMYPLMLGIGVASGFSSANANPADLMRIIPDQAYIVCFGALLAAMGSMVNPAVSTAISREGECWPFAISLPVAQEDRYAAKLIAGFELNALCSALILAVVGFFTKVSVVLLVCAFLFSLLIDLAVAAVSLWRDATHPHFRWANENEAIKKNFNQMWGMLYWLVAIALCCVPMFFWIDRPQLLTAAMLAIAGAEAVLSVLLLFRTSRKSATLAD